MSVYAWLDEICPALLHIHIINSNLARNQKNKKVDLYTWAICFPIISIDEATNFNCTWTYLSLEAIAILLNQKQLKCSVGKDLVQHRGGQVFAVSSFLFALPP